MKNCFKIAILLLLAMSFMIFQVWAGDVGSANIHVYSGNPTNPTTEVPSMTTLFVGVDGLQPFERYDIKIVSGGGILIAEYTLNAIKDGRIPPTPMWGEAGLLPVAPNGGPADPRVDMKLGPYTVTITGPNTTMTSSFTVVPSTTPLIWSSDSVGRDINGFQVAKDYVFATGSGFGGARNVNIYIMRDKDIWSTGDILNDPKLYFAIKPAVTSTSGTLGPVNFGLAAFDTAHGNCANFDIVVDANLNGILDTGDAVDSQNAAGYTVQMPPSPSNRRVQLASNGHAVDMTLHWDATFYYPDIFNHDGSGTGFPWQGFGQGVFCILNPLIDDTNPSTQLIEGSMVQIWVITLADFNTLPSVGYRLFGKDVSDPRGLPDLVSVHRTCGNGCGAILIWSAPLDDRRGYPYVPGTGYVVIVEKPDAAGLFDNIYNPSADYVDGVLNSGPYPANQGFSVVGP